MRSCRRARLAVVRWLVVGAVAIVVYDAVTAMASGPLGFEYGAWWPGFVGSVAIYAAAAFMAARDRGSAVAGAATGFGVGVVDAVVGWPVSGAFIPGYFPGGIAGEVVQTVAFVAVAVGLIGAIIGLIAGLLGARRRRARADAPG